MTSLHSTPTTVRQYARGRQYFIGRRRTYTVNVTVKRRTKPDRYVFQYRKGDLDGIKRDMGEFGAKFLPEEIRKRQLEPIQGKLSEFHEEKYSLAEGIYQIESALDDS